jgi:lipopolysaccharide export system protein LptC
MKGASQALWLFLLILGLSISGWYFASTPIQIRLDKTTLDNSIDAEATHLTVKQYNEEGLLVNYLYSPHMQHIPNKNTHILTQPDIQVHQKNKPSWSLTSQKATSVGGGEETTFENQVLIHQDEYEKNQARTIKTDLLHYLSKTKYVWTNAPVIFEQGPNIMRSRGMKAFLDNKSLQLLSEARATYVPNAG